LCDGAGELWCSVIRGGLHVAEDIGSAGALAEESDVVRIATKGGNVGVNP
jgi:hypothetical protein